MPDENPNRMADIFQSLRADIDECQVRLARQVFVHPLGDRHAPRRRTALHPDCQVDPFAKQVIVLDHHIGHDDSGPQLQCLAIGGVDWCLIELLLQPRNPLHRRNRAGELGKNAIPHCLENTAAIVADGGLDAFREDMADCRKRCRLVKLGQP